MKPRRLKAQVKEAEKKQTKDQVDNVRRLQGIIRNKIFPILIQYNQNIRTSKLFLQTAAIGLDTAFNETSKLTKVEAIIPRLKEIFSNKDKSGEMDFYHKLFEIGRDETLSDFMTLVESLPREIEKFFMQEIDKRPIMEVDLDKLLG